MKFDRITVDPAKMNGEPCIRNLRLTVRRILEALATYPDRAELKREYPELEDEDIRQALAFAAAYLDDKVLPLPLTQWSCCWTIGLPRSTTQHLQKHGIKAIHVGDVGLAAAEDAAILEHAKREGQVVASLDADFHRLLVLSGAAGPSVIRVRIEGLRAAELAELLLRVADACRAELDRGAIVTVTDTGIRLRRLPLVR
jgi:uncharacterized protein (DUF433 family)/predicted nuclease of predicted toxin-antitoxin system